MTRRDVLELALLVAFVAVAAVFGMVATFRGAERGPVYLEVEVPDRLLECVRIGDGLSCNWSDPLTAVSSRAIEQLPDGRIVEIEFPGVPRETSAGGQNDG